MKTKNNASPTTLSDISIHAWIQENTILNEKGDPIEFANHLFLYDIYRDQSDKLVCMKAAQIGFSTMAILKNMYDARYRKIDIVYTLPTDGDVVTFVGGKVNRIIANNPILLEYTQDKDSVEQKQIGQSTIYFRGTWVKKNAIMITADRLVHDEKDSSKQDVIRDYQSRLQHSKCKQTHVFSHPSMPNNGVDVEWQLSDKKEWFITCPHCKHEQNLSWNTEDPLQMSIDIERKKFVCKKCHNILSPKDRAIGRWIAQNPGAVWSGYHISLLLAPWVTAEEIVEKYEDPNQSTDYFYNKVLGLPYAGSGNIVSQETILGAITTEKNSYEGRLVIGVDTGKKLHYVVGNQEGLLDYGIMTDYMPDDTNKLPLERTLEYYLKQFPDSRMVIDEGGDIIGSRKLKAKYPGRVILCHYAPDRKSMEIARWGTKDENGNVLVDRNRAIQWVVEEFREKRIKLFNGTRESWYDYSLHWTHIYRTKEEDGLGVERMMWHRSNRDDWVHATVYWRIGVGRFGGVGSVSIPSEVERPEPNSYYIDPDGTATFDFNELIGGTKEMYDKGVQLALDALEEDGYDWRYA